MGMGEYEAVDVRLPPLDGAPGRAREPGRLLLEDG